MIKLLVYKNSRMNKDTMIMLNFDATVEFNRLYYKYGNMLDSRKHLTA